ncbi:MAG: hypothetical protein DRO39_08085 [Thermoprotei archaeon]|nr:MAG: hypothetical protein DRO39_08085 [Thermoprotei archaeon]
MPIGKEVLLKRVEYLRDVQRSLEGAIKEGVAIVIASPIINLFVRYTEMFIVIATVIGASIVYAVYSLFKIQKEIRRVWEELMKEDPIYERIPPIAVFGVLALVASIIALLLTW